MYNFNKNMKNFFKKTFFFLAIFTVLTTLLAPVALLHAQTDSYKLLEPLPCEKGSSNCADGQIVDYDVSTGNIGQYLNIMIKIVIGIAAVLAVVMIVIGGMEYMTSELISSKEAGKSRMTNAILGLVVALGAYALLYTINPNILNTEIKIGEVTLKYSSVENTILGRLGQAKGQCVPVTTPSNPCFPGNLVASFGQAATQASSICNGESHGVTDSASGADRGSDGNPFSFGLFQVNIIAHASEIGDGQICKGVFQVDPNPPGKQGTSGNDNTLGGCLERKQGICLKYAAQVVDQSKYAKCVAFITKPEENIKFAANLQSKASNHWGQWGFNASCGF
jgi:hypothetical protein